MKLHDAVIEVLGRHGGGWMRREDVAREIAAGSLYLRPSDEKPPPPDQLRRRARSPTYAHLFECSDTACTRIRLRSGVRPPERATNASRLQREPTSLTLTDPTDEAAPTGFTIPEDESHERPVAPGKDAARARERRARAAAAYRPETVVTLLIARAPPTSKPNEPERYFYYEDVAKHDGLFRGVVRRIFGRYPDREEKPEFLAAIRDQGFFLIDLKLDPPDLPPPLEECVEDAVERATAINPERVILIKTDVYDLAFRRLADAGLPVVARRMPFPGSGRQTEFQTIFSRALEAWPER